MPSEVSCFPAPYAGCCRSSSHSGSLGFLFWNVFVFDAGLAESLRSELILYGISVHAYFPATILSPGFEEENKTKPKITLEIEGADEGLTPAQCAKGLIKGKSPLSPYNVATQQSFASSFHLGLGRTQLKLSRGSKSAEERPS